MSDRLRPPSRYERTETTTGTTSRSTTDLENEQGAREQDRNARISSVEERVRRKKGALGFGCEVFAILSLCYLHLCRNCAHHSRNGTRLLKAIAPLETGVSARPPMLC
jgi:hypothetical protein